MLLYLQDIINLATIFRIMENSSEINKGPINNPVANDTRHYTVMTIGVFITCLGAILRFFGEAIALDVASNVIFLIGVIISFVAVFRILKS